jgi:hypothetical protein
LASLRSTILLMAPADYHRSASGEAAEGFHTLSSTFITPATVTRRWPCDRCVSGVPKCGVSPSLAAVWLLTLLSIWTSLRSHPRICLPGRLRFWSIVASRMRPRPTSRCAKASLQLPLSSVSTKRKRMAPRPLKHIAGARCLAACLPSELKLGGLLCPGSRNSVVRFRFS